MVNFKLGLYGLASKCQRHPAHSPRYYPLSPLRLPSPAHLPHAKDPTDDPLNVGGTNNILILGFHLLGMLCTGKAEEDLADIGSIPISPIPVDTPTNSS